MTARRLLRNIDLLLLYLLAASCGVAEPRNTSYLYPPFAHNWGVVRARPFHLRLFLGNRVRFDNPQGLACVRLDSWEDTSTVDDDDEVTVYGVNSGGDCIIYNRSMYSLGVFGLDPGQPRLDHPWGIAADRTGRVYVADRGSSRVLRLQNDGKNLTYLGAIGSPGDSIGEFLDPRGLALIPDGRVFVTDSGLDKVAVFDDFGRIVMEWGGLEAPDGIAAVGPGEPDAYYPGDAFVVVIDSLGRRVSKFSLDGKLLKRVVADNWKTLVTPSLAYCALDYLNQVLITDRANGCIHKLDRNLVYITSFGESGGGDYQFDEPRGITLYRKFGQIFVAEREGAQYLWTATNITSFKTEVAVDSIRKDLRITFDAAEAVLVDCDVYDRQDRFITRFCERRRYGTGSGDIYWNMIIPVRTPDRKTNPIPPPPCEAGQPLPPGDYKVKVTFRATYSSREVFCIRKEGAFLVRK